MDAKDIAGRLTKAQRQAVMVLPAFNGVQWLTSYAMRTIRGVRPVTQTALREKGLAAFRGEGTCGLTPLGLAVREAIMQEEG